MLSKLFRQKAGDALPRYQVEQLGRSGPEPQSYNYAILTKGRIVTEYGHDFRNDERWLIARGRTHVVDISMLEGGGPKPLTVTAEGVDFLDRVLDC